MSSIWVFLMGGAGTLVAAYWLGRETLRHGLIVGAVGVISLIAYAFAGAPGMSDRPYLKRQAELADQDPSTMTLAETLSRLERLTQERPDDPEPHFFIAELMKVQGRDSDAMRAYQSALRRDDAYVPALTGLADALVRQGNGEISPDAQAIYARAYRLDQSELRAGFMVGLADWQSGQTDTADLTWDGLKRLVPEGDPRGTMLDAWIDAAKSPQ